MFFRGPFQCLTYCDSGILGRKFASVSTPLFFQQLEFTGQQLSKSRVGFPAVAHSSAHPQGRLSAMALHCRALLITPEWLGRSSDFFPKISPNGFFTWVPPAGLRNVARDLYATREDTHTPRHLWLRAPGQGCRSLSLHLAAGAAIFLPVPIVLPCACASRGMAWPGRCVRGLQGPVFFFWKKIASWLYFLKVRLLCFPANAWS